MIVAQVRARPPQQVDLAEDAGEAEIVLILQIATVGPLDDEHGEPVLPADEEIRHVKFARAVADLAVTGKTAVEPDIESAVHALEIQKIRLSAVRLGFKRAQIQAAGVVLRHMRRVDGKRIFKVDVVGLVVRAVQIGLPAPRHTDHVAGVKRRGDVRLAEILKRRIPAKAPFAAELLESRRVGAAAIPRRRL